MQNPSILEIIFNHLKSQGIKTVSLVSRYEVECINNPKTLIRTSGLGNLWQMFQSFGPGHALDWKGTTTSEDGKTMIESGSWSRTSSFLAGGMTCQRSHSVSSLTEF